MYAKLAVLSAAVLGFAFLGRGVMWQRYQVSPADTAHIVLLPGALGGAAMLRDWRNPRNGTIVERGALYAAGTFGPTPVMLDFFRGDPREHNGIGCFLNQGETLVSERLRTFDTAGGPVIFDVALLRSENRLRLVAATECTANGCSERRFLSWTLIWQQGLSAVLRRAPAGVVPTAIILTHVIDAGHGEGIDEAAIGARLLAELERAAAAVDLRPAQRLAAAQAEE